jgi:trimethyllysine dioxygenase
MRILGWYGLEGVSENIFVSGFAVLNTLKEEAPDLFESLIKAPLTFGRVAKHYQPNIYQGGISTVVTLDQGFPNTVKYFRWHPHLAGPLLTSFDGFHNARLAHQKFFEIMRRGSHQMKFFLKPGDLYLWDNSRIFHGRERVVEVPRTGVGQTVPEQVVADTYRELKMRQLAPYIDRKWLIHLPPRQLHNLLTLIEEATSVHPRPTTD